MHNTNFQQYLMRLHELGEFGIAMDEAKDFLAVYALKKVSKEAVQDLSNDLTHLQSRWSSLEREAQKGVLDRRDLTRERNEISHTLLTWLEAFKKAPLTNINYTDFGQGLSADLREKIFGKEEEEVEGLSTPPNRRWVIWLLSILVLPLGYMGYRYFQPNEPIKDKCVLKTGYFTKIYSKPDRFSTVIMATGVNEEFEPIDYQGVKDGNNHYFKIKVGNTEGWLSYDEVEQTAECFKIIEKSKEKETVQNTQGEKENETSTKASGTIGTASGESNSSKPKPKPQEPVSNPSKPNPKPQESVSPPKTENDECYLTGGMLTTLFSEPNMFSQRIGKLKNGGRYKILAKTIYNHGNLSKINFYKVNDGNGNIGWIMQDSDLQITSDCR